MTQPTPARWEAVLAPLDVPSGDGRMIASPPGGEPRVRPLPLPLLYQPTLDDGHTGSVVVGAMERVWVEGGKLRAAGAWDLADQTALDVIRRVHDGMLRGVSVDLDDVTSEVRCVDENGKAVPCPEPDPLDEELGMMVVEGEALVDAAVDWRVMSAAILPQPAFAEAEIWLVDEPQPINEVPEVREPTVAAHSVHTVTGDADLPIAGRDMSWDADAAAARVAELAGGVDDLDPAAYSRAFLYRDPDAPADQVGSYKLGFADVVDGSLQAVPAGVFAVAGALQGARGGVDIPPDEQEQIKGRVNGYYERMADQFDDPTIVPPWESEAAQAVAAVRRVLTAAATRQLPSAAWFADLTLDTFTPWRVEPDGRVWGHIAAWQDDAGRPTCHIGFPGACREVPRSATGYAYFHTGVVRTDGGPVSVGTLTVGCGHAADRASFAEATQWYADSGNGVAVGRVGEDRFGIWFAGCTVPGITDTQLATLERVTVSPDWRTIGGNLEMVGLLGVNTGGFPVPRATADGQRPLSLVAAGAIARRPAARRGLVDLDALADHVAARLTVREEGRQRTMRAAVLAVRGRRVRAHLLAAAVRR